MFTSRWLSQGFNLSSSKSLVPFGLVLGGTVLLAQMASAATISFDSASDYDSNFQEAGFTADMK